MNLYSIKWRYNATHDKTMLILADTKKQAKLWADEELSGKKVVIHLVKDIPLPIKINFFSMLNRGKR